MTAVRAERVLAGAKGLPLALHTDARLLLIRVITRLHFFGGIDTGVGIDARDHVDELTVDADRGRFAATIQATRQAALDAIGACIGIGAVRPGVPAIIAATPRLHAAIVEAAGARLFGADIAIAGQLTGAPVAELTLNADPTRFAAHVEPAGPALIVAVRAEIGIFADAPIGPGVTRADPTLRSAGVESTFAVLDGAIDAIGGRALRPLGPHAALAFTAAEAATFAGVLLERAVIAPPTDGAVEAPAHVDHAGVVTTQVGVVFSATDTQQKRCEQHSHR